MEGPSFDMDGNGTVDFLFSTSSVVTRDFPSSSGSISLEIAMRGGTQNLYQGNSSLQAWTLLGTNTGRLPGYGLPLWNDYALSVCTYSYSFTVPGPGDHQHLGGRSNEIFLGFRIPASQGGGFHYGYLQFDFEGWKDHQPNSLITPGNPLLVGWAYETTPDTGILVQRIPELGTPVTVLGSVCLAGLFRRRGRSS